MSLPLKRTTALISKARMIEHEQKEEQRAWEMWIALYPDMIVPSPMSKGPALRFKPFSEFYKAAQLPAAPKKTKEEILKDVDEIRAMTLSSME